MNYMYFILRILRKLHILKYVNLVLSISINTESFRIPIFGGIGIDHFVLTEKWMEGLIKKLLIVKEGVFVDVGVNIGQTLLKVKSIDESMEYIGFEPNPNCIFYIDELLRCNPFQKTTILPFALSDKTGIIDLNFYSDHAIDSTASIVPGFRDKRTKSIKVPEFNGVNVTYFETRKISVLKIDVEGGELEVIKGLIKWIQRDHPIIICEILPVYRVDNSFRLNRQDELVKTITELRYLIYRIQLDGSLIGVEEIGIHDKIEDCNYLFVPAELKGVI